MTTTGIGSGRETTWPLYVHVAVGPAKTSVIGGWPEEEGRRKRSADDEGTMKEEGSFTTNVMKQGSKNEVSWGIEY